MFSTGTGKRSIQALITTMTGMGHQMENDWPMTPIIIL
jgi:hypothetical protein